LILITKSIFDDKLLTAEIIASIEIAIEDENTIILSR